MRALSGVETRMLSTVRLFADIVTLGSDPVEAQSRLLGPTICFPIDTVKRVSHHFDVNGCAENFLVVFNGLRETFGKGGYEAALREGKGRSPVSETFRVSADNLAAWYNGLSVLQPEIFPPKDGGTLKQETHHVATELPNLIADMVLLDLTENDLHHLAAAKDDCGTSSSDNIACVDSVHIPQHAVMVSGTNQYESTSGSNVASGIFQYAGSLATPTCPDGKKPHAKKIPTKLGSSPLNEYTHNDVLLGGAFPVEFLLGTKMLGKGQVPKNMTDLLLRWYDGRFQSNPRVLFLLVNQLRRFSAARSTAATVKGDSKALKTLQALLVEPGFAERAAACAKDPSSPEARKLMKTLLPLLGATAPRVPHGPGERRALLGFIRAYCLFFGLPDLWLTYSPDDNNQRLTIDRTFLSPALADAEIPLDHTPAHAAIRRATVAASPAYAADTFQLQVTVILFSLVLSFCNFTIFQSAAIHGKLFGMPLANSRRQRILPLLKKYRGIFGVPRALLGPSEAQGRGSEHGHPLYWTKLRPELISRLIHTLEGRMKMLRLINSRMTARLTDDTHQQAAAKRLSTDHSVFPFALEMACPPPFDEGVTMDDYLVDAAAVSQDWSEKDVAHMDAFFSRGCNICGALQYHTHHPTCAKYISRSNKAKTVPCRGAYPVTTCPGASRFVMVDENGDALPDLPIPSLAMDTSRAEGNIPPRDNRPIGVELRRDVAHDGYVTAFSYAHAAATGSNHSLSALTSMAETLAISFYLVSYVTKCAYSLAASLIAFAAAVR